MNGSGAPQAFARARIAARRLRALPIAERVARLRRLREVVLADQAAIMAQVERETGKVRGDALMSEIFPALDHLAYLEKHAARILRDRRAPTPLALLGKKSRVYFEPLGTVLVISPWNYPFYQALAPCTSAFVVGNAVVYKPSEHTPLRGLLERLLKEAGFEPDWIQVVYGDGRVGADLLEQRPQKVFFTGSTATGKKLMAQAAPHLIPVELELGGKDPMIVFKDANLARAAAGAAWGAFTNSGQSCTSVERLYVERAAYEPFKRELLKQVERLRHGRDYGRMTVPFQAGIIRQQLEAALAQGAKLLSGAGWDRKSDEIPPIVVEDARPDSALMREETFGPVLPIVPFDTEAEAIAWANDSVYGLSASVWSKDAARADRVARALETGNVSINNVMLTEGNHALPFGGTKQSGFGRYKGEFGLYSFANIKAILVDGDSAKIEANWYPYAEEKLSLFSRMMDGLFGKGLLRLIRFAVSGVKLESLSNRLGRG